MAALVAGDQEMQQQVQDQMQQRQEAEQQAEIEQLGQVRADLL
jgi:hypothetical protein